MKSTKTNGNREARLIGLALTTALASVALSGCATSAAPPAAISAGKAEAAIAQGKHGSAISHAEAAVLAEPRNAQYRATLGAAYLEAGRYASAATTFDDALKLGDTNGRTALSLALALTAQGKNSEAQQVLGAWENAIAPGDFGLAVALAGNPQHGVNVLVHQIRNGENTPKLRQNLAYSYALNGQWREARVMASQDLAGEQVNDRIAEWAVDVGPEAYQMRVAKLLSAPYNVTDQGQPVSLALANFPDAVQLAQSSAVPAPLAPLAPVAAAQPGYELPPLGDPIDSSVGPARYEAPKSVAVPASRPAADSFETAFKAQAAPAPAPATDTARFAQETVKKPAAQPAPKPAARTAATPVSGTHLVQLGSFGSEASAKRAWSIYAKRYPELANHNMVITKAVVKGKNYWRVAAAGYSASGAKSMCGKVNGKSDNGCIAYAQGRPVPGAVATDSRLASR